ncbi:MAG TPA: prenyltransferase [Paludibacteraceae bacterium]|mgnify:FL=1|jgi:1,4-dihydroxy-2-naphthoate octaprenyltransferase|nr:prenyltransferase [Bacteroidales bacterium]HPW96652.1 prenyltransferase [Paludibacteraceae bacterium]HQP81055.1 prenyltransferase [Paludibacteraceae bacterium]
MNKLKFWIKNARDIALPQSIIPSLLAIAMAATQPDFSWWLSLIALFGVSCAHLGFNLADDYFDYKHNDVEARKKVTAEGFRTHMEKCHYIESGKATLKELLIAFCCFLAVAGIAGAVVLWFRGLPIAIIALVGLILGVSYSGKPLELGYHGLGELVIGIMFGPLLMIGMQYATCGLFNKEIVWVSIAVGLLVTNIVYSHAVLDLKADEQAGKMTFARLLKTRWAMLLFSGVFNLLPFVMLIVGVVCGQLHWAYLFVLPLVPMGIYIIYSLAAHLENKPIPFEPRWWMGPMGNFEKYRAANMDWFLIRWLVARNLVIFFCLILTVVNIIFTVI